MRRLNLSFIIIMIAVAVLLPLTISTSEASSSWMRVRGLQTFPMRGGKTTDNQTLDLGVTRVPAHRIKQTVQSQGETSIVFSASTDTSFNTQIYSVSPSDMSNVRQLTNDANSYSTNPNLSRDGSKIVYAARNAGAINTMNADGSNKTRIFSSGNYPGEPAWSPDGNKVLFTKYFTNTQPFRYDMYLMNSDGSNVRSLTYPNANSYSNAGPRMSADGTQIVFSQILDLQNGQYFARIGIMNSDGSNLHLVPNIFYALSPAWSPDGAKIAFNTSDGIYVVNIDGSGLQKINANGYYPVWSPDGSKIAFERDENGTSSIYTMAATGGGETKIVGGYPHLLGISWGPLATPQADLSVTNIGLPLQVVNGDNITYALTITNNGPSAATAVTVIDNLPAETTFVSCTSSRGVCTGTNNNRTIIFNSLEPGATELITLVAKVNSSVIGGTVISNTATVSSVTPDADSSNNSKTATVTVKRTSITLPVQRWSQLHLNRDGSPAPDGGLWGDDTYDHHPGTIIRQNGCALTSLAMALRFAGVNTLPNNMPLDPGSLNTFMNSQPVDYNQNHDVIFSNSARDASPGVTWNNLAANATADDVISVLSQGYPVIARVTNPTSGGGHYVLITGVQDDGTFTIQDPGYATRTTLAPYGNQFSARGFVAPVITLNLPNERNLFSQALTNAVSNLDRSALNFSVGDKVGILVIDSAGRRTGIDPGTGQILEEIPNSHYYLDGVSDDDTDGPTNETDHTVTISTPSQGSYTVKLTGRRSGTYEVKVGIYSQDGSVQPPLFITGPSAVGSTASYQIQFTPTPALTLLTEEGAGKAIALDSVTFTRDPFLVITPYNFSSDQHTRLTLFAGNLKLLPGETASAITAQAEDAQHRVYPLTVEYVGKVSPFNWLTQVVVKLPDEISHSGDVLVSISLHGVISNKAAIRIN